MPTASYLRDRREAVRGAGGVRDDDVVLRQLVVVDAVDDREIGAVGGSRDDDALGAGLRCADAFSFEVKMPVH